MAPRARPLAALQSDGLGHIPPLVLDVPLTLLLVSPPGLSKTELPGWDLIGLSAVARATSGGALVRSLETSKRSGEQTDTKLLRSGSMCESNSESESLQIL